MKTPNHKSSQIVQPFSPEEIAAFRKDTEGCANSIHLNNAGASLMPNPVTQSIFCFSTGSHQ
jgi:hypothetical protein